MPANYNYTNYFYEGKGEQKETQPSLPFVNPDEMRAPSGYRAGAGLRAAVDVALKLGMPLLLTGEPGVGKSQLAHSLSWELNFGEPLHFSIKSDTESKDLFYHFDNVGRFHAASFESEKPEPIKFISFNALGKAILYTRERESLENLLGETFTKLDYPGEPCRSVVLIDEIDKAPRDLPNDLLTEIDEMKFEIPELPETGNFAKEKRNSFFEVDKDIGRPIVIITSNSEKSLPGAFLRRCIYYHVPFPPFYDASSTKEDEQVSVQSIVASRLIHRYEEFGENLVNDAISFFKHLREQTLERKPGLAELLNWLDYLLPQEGNLVGNQELADNIPLGRLVDINSKLLLNSIKATLLKNKIDQHNAENLFRAWKNSIQD